MTIAMRKQCYSALERNAARKAFWIQSENINSYMKIQHFFEETSSTFTYLVSDPKTQLAVVIDPVLVYEPNGGTTSTKHADTVLSAASSQGLQIALIIETHAHADHLTAAQYIKKRTGAPVSIGRGIQTVQQRFKRLFNLGSDFNPDGSQFDRLYEDGETFAVGNLEFRVMSTPGHTSDSCTYLVGDAAFIGDTLFRPDYGCARCDFPGGDAGLLFDSVKKIHGLPDGTRLFLCHDYPSTGVAPRCMIPVEESRMQNIRLKEGSVRDAFVRWRNERDRQMDVPRLILPSLQVNIRAGCLPNPESNAVSYLKIPLNQDLSKLTAD